MTPPVAYANIAFFYAIQSLVSAHALIRGGSPERAAGGTLIIAAVASSAAQVIVGMDFNRLAWTLLAIDVVLSIVVLVIAALADRFWPIWLASLQVLAVANHGVRAYDAAILSYVYWLIAGKIAYPMLAILFVGTQRHHRRLAVGLQEFGWTFQRKRS
jgi:hypothetical protein